MKKLPLRSPMLALALLPLLLAACGGSDDKDSGSNSNNPADPQAGATQKSKHPPIPDTGVAPPNDEEKAAFNASKISIEPYNALNGAKPAPFLITAEDGTPTRGFDGENAQRDFSKLPSGFTSVKGTLTLVKNDNNGGTNPTPAEERRQGQPGRHPAQLPGLPQRGRRRLLRCGRRCQQRQLRHHHARCANSRERQGDLYRRRL